MSLNKHGFNLTGCWRHTTGFKMCGNLIKDFCIVWLQREEDLLFIYAAVQRQLSKSKSPPKSTAAFWARRAAGSVVIVHTVPQGCHALRCPAFHSPLASFLPCLSLRSVLGGVESRGVLRKISDMLEVILKRMDSLSKLDNTSTTDARRLDELSSAINRYVEYSFHITAYNWN